MAGLVHTAPKDLSRMLRVIGTGQGRTGSSSFTLALEILLQGPVMHSGSACLAREESFIKSWIDICNQPDPDSEAGQEAIKPKLRDLCAGFVGITDSPAIFFTRELVELYPDAVVICTTRDPDKWWKSMEPVAKKVMAISVLSLVLAPVPTVRYFGTWIKALTKRADHLYGPGMTRENLAKHENYVRSVVPHDRLFFFNVKDGWGPLCEILDVPVPDVPFPHANDAQAVQELMEGFIKRALVRWLVIFSTVGVAGAAVLWAWR